MWISHHPLGSASKGTGAALPPVNPEFASSRSDDDYAQEFAGRFDETAQKEFFGDNMARLLAAGISSALGDDEVVRVFATRERERVVIRGLREMRDRGRHKGWVRQGRAEEVVGDIDVRLRAVAH